ncbi:MAG: inorganic phosphate transporter, partial [Oscillospiraceae bacterium]|nr:inorganic phosphate transporter [Oscillospiraceae bacterium]
MGGSGGLVHLLTLAVIFVNGWTDAPNAIATAVGSGALTFRRGVVLAAACNFAGAALACLCFPAVADTVGELVAFGDPRSAAAALNAALLSIVLWAVAAWRFGLPTSESHALLAGLSGGALALGSASLNAGAWIKALAGLGLSLPAST